jgi:hypothetical protein
MPTPCSTASLLAIEIILCLSSLSRADSPEAGWDLAHWASWRDTKITSFLTPTRPTDKPTAIERDLVITKCAAALAELSPVLQADPAYFTHNPQLAGSMQNFLSFVQAQSLMAPTTDTKHQLGFTVTDQDYWAAASDMLVFPDFLKNQNFLQLMSDPATYEKGIAMLKQYSSTLPAADQWLILPFEAQFIKSINDGGVDEDGHPFGRTYGRMIVLVPNLALPDGGALDRWILYSLALPSLSDNAQPLPGKIRPVSMIAVRRPPATVQPLGRLKTFFMDFIRTKDPATNEISMVPTALTNHSKNCYDCHKSAVLAIRPQAELEFVGGVIQRKPDPIDYGNSSIEGKLIGRIADYKHYGLADWGYMDNRAYGPSLGPDIVRSDDFVSSNTQDLHLSANSISRVLDDELRPLS